MSKFENDKIQEIDEVVFYDSRSNESVRDLTQQQHYQRQIHGLVTNPNG